MDTNTYKALVDVAKYLLGIMSSTIIIMTFLSKSKEINPLSKIHGRLDDHETKIEENRKMIKETTELLDQRVLTVDEYMEKSQKEKYILLKSISALLNHAANPNGTCKEIEKTSEELKDYLYKK